MELTRATGSFDEDVAFAGAMTFNVKQDSLTAVVVLLSELTRKSTLPFGSAPRSGVVAVVCCRQEKPNVVAAVLSLALYGEIVCGRRKRRSPIL